MKIKNVIKYGNVTHQYNYKVFLDLLSKISKDDKRHVNYTLDKIDLTNHITFDLLMSDDNEILCFSGLYNRPEWGIGVYRSSNRTYINPIYRKRYYNFFNPTYIVPHQIREHLHEINFVFNSREHIKSKYYFKKAKKIVPFYNDWIIAEKMAKVVPRSNSKSAYQGIMYKNFTNICFPFDTINYNKWRNLSE